LVADLPLAECPGEIGVIAFKVEEILPKEAPPLPDLLAYPVVPLEQITIPDAFLRTTPSAQRTAELQAQITERGQLDEPLVVERTVEPPGYLLRDGYRRYLIARQFEWDTVPVRIEPDAVSRGKSPA
jgi:hypothetical protein